MAHNFFIKCTNCEKKYHIRMRVYSNPQLFKTVCDCSQNIVGFYHYTSWQEMIMKGGNMEDRFEGEGFERLIVDFENIEDDFKFINLDEFYPDYIR